MYTKYYRPEKNRVNISQNAGSSVKLVEYLSKEEGLGKTFFSHRGDGIDPIDVIEKIDNNKRTLKKNQDKFYMLSYSPSEREIRHLTKLVTGKNISNFTELTEQEKNQVFDEFKNFVRDCMDIYAKKFNREKELSGDDLVYFGRIEEDRYYSHDDKEVQEGIKREGDVKPGLNMHAHIIVSRMDATQTIALSPLTKSRGNTNCLNGKEVKNGFNAWEWQIESFEHFQNRYSYIATSEESFYYKNLNTSIFQNKIMQELMEGMKEEKQLVKGVRNVSYLMKSPKKIIRGYLRKIVRDILSDRENEI